MAIFSQPNRGDKDQESQFHTTTQKIYVVASQPVKNDIVSTEWSIEVEVSSPPSTQERKRRQRSSFASLRAQPQSTSPSNSTTTDPATIRRSSAVSEASTVPSHSTVEATFFTFHDGTITQTTLRPLHVVMRILLPLAVSIHPSRAQTSNSPRSRALSNTSGQDANEAFVGNIAQSLHQPTPSPSCAPLTFLRSSLSSLVVSGILPGRRSSFDVDKFIYFATRNLEAQQQRGQSLQYGIWGPDGVQEIDYAAFVSENAHLRRVMRAGTRGIDHTRDEEEDDGDEASRTESAEALAEDNIVGGGSITVKSKRVWGGFWVTYGSYSNSTAQGSRGDDRGSNAYGGLM